MDHPEKVNFILNILDKMFPNPQISLLSKNSFTFLIAVMLSAHTTDASVNKVTPELFALADNPYDMSKVNIDKISEIIRTVGCFNNKSKAIKKTSEMLVKDFNGNVPETFEDLESLAGVGHKTASVIMSQVFNHPAFPVDTHIARLAQRWNISKFSNVIKIEKDLKEFFPIEKWNKLHLQMISYGRSVCPARNHDMSKCPICLFLSSFRCE